MGRRLNQILNHIDKAIGFIAEDLESRERLRESTILAYSQALDKSKKMVELCEKMVGDLEESFGEIEYEESTLDKIMSMQRKQKYQLEEIMAVLSSYVEAPEENTKSHTKKHPVEPIKNKQKYKTAFDSVLSKMIDDCTNIGRVRMYESVHLWFHTRFIECVGSKSHRYKMEYVPGWSAMMVLRYVDFSHFNNLEYFNEMVESWVGDVKADPDLPYGAPAFITSKIVSNRLQKLRKDELQSILAESKREWDAFVEEFNAISKSLDFEISLDSDTFDNKIDELGFAIEKENR